MLCEKCNRALAGGVCPFFAVCEENEKQNAGMAIFKCKNCQKILFVQQNYLFNLKLIEKLLWCKLTNLNWFCSTNFSLIVPVKECGQCNVGLQRLFTVTD